MATIRKQFVLAAAPGQVWAAVSDFGALHVKLARGFVTNARLGADGATRIVTFGNGVEVRERLVSCDHDQRRLVYAISDSARFTHYSASAEVLEEGDGSRFVWTVDFLPNEMAQMQEAAMNAGVEAMRATLS
jgi:hypothetical protein